MKKIFIVLILMHFVVFGAQAQLSLPGFGKGLNFDGPDSSFHIKFGFRFQNLYAADWNVGQGDLNNINGFSDEVLIRRARLKFDGYAFSPKLKFKVEIALSNRDIASGNQDEFRGADNVMLDAYIDWSFHKNFTLRFGQSKLPGNVERVISSANLQMVDRSLLNSRFNLDRDMGIQLQGEHNLGGNVILKEVVALSQGEGRNITTGSHDGHDYTARVELLPLGEFYKGKDDYVGSALVRYEKPKLMIGATYDHNTNAIRTRGQLGSFISDAMGKYYGKNLNSFFADAVFKYKNFSFMGEYANKKTDDNNPNVFDAVNMKIGTFTTGEAINLQAGFILNKKMSIATGKTEIVGRLTSVDYQVGTDENQYTIGINRFISGHQLKIQADLTYADRKAVNGNDGLMFRLQTDVHF